MRRRRNWVGVGPLATCLLVALTACIGFWDTPIQLANLLVSDVMVIGTQGTVFIAVADMPDGGAASIQFGTVANEAIAFANIDVSTITIEGENGFVVLAEEFTTIPSGKGTLIAANANTGIVSGQILKFTFEVTGANPTFSVDTAKVEIGSDLNTLITAWDSSSLDYYTK